MGLGAISKFLSLKTQDPETTRLADGTREVFRTLNNIPLLDGQLVTATLVVGSNQIQHKLQRKYVGWIVTNIYNASVVYEETSVDKAIYLKLNSSIAGNVTIWVF